MSFFSFLFFAKIFFRNFFLTLARFTRLFQKIFKYEFENDFLGRWYYEVTEKQLSKEELRNQNFDFDRVNVYCTDKITICDPPSDDIEDMWWRPKEAEDEDVEDEDVEYTDVNVINSELTNDDIRNYLDAMGDYTFLAQIKKKRLKKKKL